MPYLEKVTPMSTCEKLTGHIQEVLKHLHDPQYQPSNQLRDLVGSDSQDGAVAVQSSILQQIQALEPDPDAPRDARSRQVYEILHLRYVQGLTQQRTAELMNVSVRHVNRLQKEAVHALVVSLWERSRPGGREARSDGEDRTGVQASSWRSQVEREILSLQRSGAHPTSDVEQAIDRVLSLKDVIIPNPDLDIEVAFIQPKLTVAVHPSVLDQMLIMAIRALARHVSTGPIRVFASLKDGNAAITMTGALGTEGAPTEHDLAQNILIFTGASVGVDVDGGHIFLRIGMPSVSKITVLVVEDNADIVRFFRRSTAGTKYRIVHIGKGQKVFDAVETVAPDVIVMDIMLPDVDGWHLLMRLHENPATRSTPVVVCTVVREEELALSLGAALYLAKPVRAHQFTEALDQVLTRA
jgi:CheY-like chemotaxis protein